MTEPNFDILVDCRLELAEGPTWDSQSEELIWVDILAGGVFLASLDSTRPVRRIDVGTHVGAALPSAVGGELLLCVRDGFARLDLASERLTPVARPLADRPQSRFNDAKVAPGGRAFGGTMPYRAGDEEAELYRLDEGELARPMLNGLGLSNGLGWSPDARHMYLVDSGARTVLTCEYEESDGALGAPRPLIEFDLPDGFMPDGLCVDDAGGIWVALWGCGEVRRYTPGGVLDATLDLPVSQPTSICFAGTRGDTMIVTSASYGLDPAQLAREPHAGSLFVFAPGETGPAATPWNPELIGL